jgi:hypothetical protein
MSLSKLLNPFWGQGFFETSLETSI